jgi:hypothetical protein
MSGKLQQISYNPIQALQALVPRTRLDHGEGLVVAEVQATALLKMVGVVRPPVPVLLLARHLDVTCQHDPAAGEIGNHRLQDGSWCVGYGATTSSDRDATVAHQIKLILDAPFDVRELYPPVAVMSPVLRKYHAAEYFAQCLTVPGRFVQLAWRDGQRDVYELAELFGVTPKGMLFRLKTLRLMEPEREL